MLRHDMMPGTRSFFAATLLLVCCFLYSGQVHAAPQPLVMETEDERMVRWDLNADSIVTLNDAEIMEATGNVHLRRGNEYLKADFARYYMSTKWVYLKGNVVVRTGRDEIKAEEAEFDLRSRVGWLKQGRIFMDGPHAYLAGERIDKHWGDVYTFKKAKVTTCDGDVPAWSLSADEAVVEIDGYARLTRSSFQVKDTPVAYTPFFLFPTKTSRQTGLLRPEFGRSSQKGLYYNQPFFWAIDDHSDLTVNEYIMEQRGFMHGVEYRTRPAADTSAWFRADWLYDKKRKTDPDSGEYSGDGLVRKNYDRYWLRGMVDTRLPDPEWRFKMDLDYVSDQYFLSEFSDGLAGFERSRNELQDWFGRDLQEKDLKRLSGFLLSRDWDRVSIAFSALYSQDQTLGNGNRARRLDDTVQHLPQFDAFLHKGRIVPWLPLEVDATAQAAYMYRRTGTKGARYEVVPRLTLPVNTRYGSIIASGSVYQTFYDSENASYQMDDGRVVHSADGRAVDGVRQNGSSRTVPEFNIAAFTELARVYDLSSPPLTLDKESVGTSRWTALRHSIQPRLEFRQREYDSQDRNPRYSSDDRLSAQSELVYSLTNVITRKRERVVMEKDENGEMVPALKTSYQDMVRLRLEQAFNRREAVRDDDRDIYPRRPFGDLFADLEVWLTDSISLRTRNDWSPYENEFTRHQSGVNFNFPEYGTAYVGYDLRNAIDEYTRYRADDVRYLRLGFQTAQYGAWSLSASTTHDYRNLDNKETDIDLIYNHQCFKIIGRMSVEPQEETYQIYFMLTGLGD